MANISEPLSAAVIGLREGRPATFRSASAGGRNTSPFRCSRSVVSSLLFSLFLLALGKSPIEFFELVERGGFGTAFSLQNTLQRSAPLILTALAVAVPARIGLIMIGGEGALVLGGFASAVIAIPLVLNQAPPFIALDRDGDHRHDRRRAAGSALPAICAMRAASTRRSPRCC